MYTDTERGRGRGTHTHKLQAAIEREQVNTRHTLLHVLSLEETCKTIITALPYKGYTDSGGPDCVRLDTISIGLRTIREIGLPLL